METIVEIQDDTQHRIATPEPSDRGLRASVRHQWPPTLSTPGRWHLAGEATLAAPQPGGPRGGFAGTRRDWSAVGEGVKLWGSGCWRSDPPPLRGSSGYHCEAEGAQSFLVSQQSQTIAPLGPGNQHEATVWYCGGQILPVGSKLAK